MRGLLYTITPLLWIFMLVLNVSFAASNTEIPAINSSPRQTNDQNQTNNYNLPLLGDTVSAIITPEQEYHLGRAWLRSLRPKTKVITDPLLNDYVENMLYRLAAHSELQYPDFEWLILNNATINAFAAPGGIIGVNAGLFIYAETEAEFAATLAHELAHLSQRHYARNLEQNQRGQFTQLAALLGSIALMATVGGDPGIAALASTQALAYQNRLKFSREHELEADYIGMQTLTKAGIDPFAMPSFFEKLSQTTQFQGLQAPEFLLTHPVTQNRIANSRNRATHLARFKQATSLEYQLMRARLLASFNLNINQLNTTKDQQTFQNITPNANSKHAPQLKLTQQYRVMYTLYKNNKIPEALKLLQQIRQQDPTRITFIATEAEIYLKQKDYQSAQQLLVKQLQHNPQNYPLTVYYIQSLIYLKQPQQAIPILEQQLAKKPNSPYLWQLMAKVYQQTNNRIGAHRAQAEVYFQANQMEQAIEQLQYALNYSRDNFQISSKIVSRLEEFKAYSKSRKF